MWQQLQLFVFQDFCGVQMVDFPVLVGWVDVVSHIFDSFMDYELVSQPRLHLRNALVDSFKRCNLLDNLSFERLRQIVLSMLELAALHILFDVLNGAAIRVVEDMDGADFVQEW